MKVLVYNESIVFFKPFVSDNFYDRLRVSRDSLRNRLSNFT